MKKTEEKIKKALRNWERCTLLFLVALMAYLAIILPIRLYVAVFSWHWFMFGLVAIIVPFAFIFLYFWSQKRFANELQKKNAISITVKYILYFWLLDCLYMVIFNQWKIWIYILGVITLIKIFYSLTVAFLGARQKNIIIDMGLIFDFLLGVALTVYLIYLIPKELNQLQTIVTAIIAAVYGGLLTLIGVAWTIKKGDRDRKEERKQYESDRVEEERKKYKPIFNVFNTEYRGSHVLICKESFYAQSGFSPDQKTDSCGTRNEIPPFLIHNLDFSSFYVYGFKLNNDVIKFSSFRFVDKGAFLKVEFPTTFFLQDKLKTLNILVIDMLDNVYEVSLNIKQQELIDNTYNYPKLNALRYCSKVISNGRAQLTNIKVDD